MYKIDWIKIAIFTIVFLCSIIFSSLPVSAQIEPGKTLKIVIDKPTVENLTTNSVSTEMIPPDTYQLNFTQDYYAVKIFDDSDTELFTGTVKSRIILPPPDPLGPNPPVVGPAEDPYIQLTLNLPFFANASTVRIFSETGVLLLEIPLELYGFPSTPFFYAECDSCGYCRNQRVPQSWESCRACIYPAANPTPAQGDTLRLDENNVAATPAPGNAFSAVGCIRSPFSFSDASGRSAVAQTILNLIFRITGGIALVFLMYGAFLYLTSRGDQEQVARARKIIYRTVIGTVIVFLAVFLISLIGSVLRIPGFRN